MIKRLIAIGAVVVSSAACSVHKGDSSTAANSAAVNKNGTCTSAVLADIKSIEGNISNVPTSDTNSFGTQRMVFSCSDTPCQQTDEKYERPDLVIKQCSDFQHQYGSFTCLVMDANQKVTETHSSGDVSSACTKFSKTAAN